MKISSHHKEILRNIFLALLIFTILFFIYKQFNPFVFPELEVKLFIATFIFGCAWLFLSFQPHKQIKIITKKSIDINKKFIYFFVFLIPYSFFLWWIFPKLTFIEFILFPLLLYIPLSFLLNLETRIPIVIALILLVSCAAFLASGNETFANELATYAYYFLVLGVTIQFIDYLKTEKKST